MIANLPIAAALECDEVRLIGDGQSIEEASERETLAKDCAVTLLSFDSISSSPLLLPLAYTLTCYGS